MGDEIRQLESDADPVVPSENPVFFAAVSTVAIASLALLVYFAPPVSPSLGPFPDASTYPWYELLQVKWVLSATAAILFRAVWLGLLAVAGVVTLSCVDALARDVLSRLR
jgi:hypothetical protein